MSEEDSNDVIPIETSGVDSGGQPIKGLLRRLVSNDSKTNTVLTNSQIIDILKKEFDIEMSSLHELELEIYLAVMKKFLKDWPQWDEFDQIINELKNDGTNEQIESLLVSKYNHLKTYLGTMLDLAKPMAKEASQAVNVKKKKENKVVMEVHCTRNMLNTFIFRKPNKDLNNTIFNLKEPTPSKITLNLPSVKAILNYWSVTIHINLKNLVFVRATEHQLKHVLVNKKNDCPETPWEPLDPNMYEKSNVNKDVAVEKKVIIQNLSRINDQQRDIELQTLLEIIIDMLEKDLELAPDVITVPVTYRKNMTNYPYRRYLYTDVENGDNSFDIQLEETISPKVLLLVRKVSNCFIGPMPPQTILDRIIIECKQCKVQFCGPNSVNILENHFSTHHVLNEPDWTCVNCEKEFKMSELCENFWHHEC